jgi:phosphate transport system permease protein
MSATSDAPAAAFRATDQVRRRLRNQRLAIAVFATMAVIMLVPLVLILTQLVISAWPSLSWDFISQVPRTVEVDGQLVEVGGIWPALIGTIYLVVGSLLVAAPIGVLAGVYLNEFARDNWLTRVVNLAVVNLAGVPSIVIALFGVGAFVEFAHLGKSVMAAALTLAVMTLPVIIVATKEALSAVPRSFREACWNVGASRWQTIRTVVLPNSIGGILTGLILEVCRAAGETAPILFVGVVASMTVHPGLFAYDLNDQFMALSFQLHYFATQARNLPESMVYATAVVLVGFVLAFNSAAILLRVRLRARKKW